MNIRLGALETTEVRRLQAGGADSNGQIPEIAVSDGDGNPCRHCLAEIPLGGGMLILGYRPFPALQPYAETGPIFLCAGSCCRYPETAVVPDLYKSRSMLLRGYDTRDRIVYGTGAVVAAGEFIARAESLLDVSGVEYLHARSPTNNCYHFRIDTA